MNHYIDLGTAPRQTNQRTETASNIPLKVGYLIFRYVDWLILTAFLWHIPIPWYLERNSKFLAWQGFRPWIYTRRENHCELSTRCSGRDICHTPDTIQLDNLTKQSHTWDEYLSNISTISWVKSFSWGSLKTMRLILYLIDLHNHVVCTYLILQDT